MSKEKTKEKMPDIETLEKNAELYIYGYFEDIKRKVDLRREDLIQRIHNYSDEIIKSIEDTQSECLKMPKEVNQLIVEVEKSKKNLNKLINNFDKRWKSLIVLNENFTKVLEEYNDYDSTFGFNKYSFDFNEVDVKDVFGYFSEIQKLKFDSTIMDIGLQNQLAKLCEFPVGQKWELKYRASKDGFSSSDFHSHCDGIPNTLTVIKAKSGNILGGFTEQAWHSRDEFVTDSKAFIFSLINKEKNPFKVMCSNCKYAICCNSIIGPCFGGDDDNLADIFIDSDSNISKESYSGFGYSYKHPDYKRDTDKADNILAGSLHFKTLEIEVYAKSN